MSFKFKSTDTQKEVLVKLYAYQGDAINNRLPLTVDGISNIELISRDSENAKSEIEITYAATGFKEKIEFNMIDGNIVTDDTRLRCWEYVRDQFDSDFNLKSSSTPTDVIQLATQCVSSIHLLTTDVEEDGTIWLNGLNKYFSYSVDKEKGTVTIKHNSFIFTDMVLDFNRADYVMRDTSSTLPGFEEAQWVGLSA